MLNIKKIINNKLFQASSWYTMANVFVKGINFITIPIFTRLLTTEDYGMVSLYLSWVSLFSVLISLDLGWSVQRAKFDFEERYNKYISSTLILSIFLLLIFLFLFSVFEGVLLSLTGLSRSLFYFMIFQSYFTFVQSLAMSKFGVEYKYRTVSLVNILVSIASVILSIVFIKKYFIGFEYIGKILGSGSLIIVLGLFYLVYFIYKGREFISVEYWKYGLRISIPYLLHNVSGIITSQFDKIIINRYIGKAATGIYSFSYNIGMIINVIYMSFYQAYAPYFLEKMEDKQFNLIRNIGAKFRDIFTLIYAIVLFISPEIIRFMAQESYWEGIVIIPFIFLAYYFTFIYSFELYVEYYYKMSKYISLGTLISAITNIILNLIFIPKYGYLAAAITTAASYFVQIIYHYLITRYVLNVQIYGLKFHLTSLMYVFFITLFFFVSQPFLFLRVMGVIIVLILGYLKIVKKR